MLITHESEACTYHLPNSYIQISASSLQKNPPGDGGGFGLPLALGTLGLGTLGLGTLGLGILDLLPSSDGLTNPLCSLGLLPPALPLNPLKPLCALPIRSLPSVLSLLGLGTSLPLAELPNLWFQASCLPPSPGLGVPAGDGPSFGVA